MKKIMIVLMMAVLLIGIVSAVEVSYSESSETNYPADNWLGRLISQIKFSIFNEGTFTIYGRELGCSDYPDDTAKFKRFIGYKFVAEDGEALFVNWFRGSPTDGIYKDHPDDSRQFMREDYIEEGETSKFVCDASAYWNYDCYGEYYICPVPCYSDSDCSSGKSCDKSILSQKIENAGVCKDEEQETHTTKVYRCENGNKTLLKSVNSGNINYCPDENKNNYLIPGSEASGVCYSESEEPLICTQSSQIGTEPSKSISLTDEEWNQATPKLVVAAMCELNSDCEIRSDLEDYKVSCIYSEDIKNINKNAISKLSLSGGDWSARLCFGTEESLIGKVGKLILGGDYGCINRDYKDPLISGTCRAEESGGLCAFFEQVSFIKITGNKCQDGTIIFVGGIILIFFLISMIGGKK